MRSNIAIRLLKLQEAIATRKTRHAICGMLITGEQLDDVLRRVNGRTRGLPCDHDRRNRVN